jgi:hypothetical protein
MHELIHLLFGQFLALDDGRLALDGLADGLAKFLLNLLVLLYGVVGLAGDVGAHYGVGCVAFLLLFTELVVDFEHIFLQIVYQHVPLLDHLIHLAHYLPYLLRLNTFPRQI